MPENAPIKSPCKLICTLDLSSGMCLGCGRSRDEIASWVNYSDTERDDIMTALPARLKQLPKIAH